MRLCTFSKGIAKTPHLLEFLHATDLVLSPSARQADDLDLVVGWGRKPNTKKAMQFAQRHNIPYASLEDGFLRSIGLGSAGPPSLSLVVDKAGIYYDAGQPSYLEELLNNEEDIFTPALIDEATLAIDFILKHRISKYNGAPEMPARVASANRKNILIIDQVMGDASLTHGAPHFSLETMVSAAQDANPNAAIHLKLHPETIHGFRKGLFTKYRNDPSIQFISEDYNPLSVIEPMDKVYVATSQMGFEALMASKEDVCFGLPFYAGWGLTDDRIHCSRRTKNRSVEEVFVAAYILYSRYINPGLGKRCGVLEALEYLESQSRMQ